MLPQLPVKSFKFTQVYNRWFECWWYSNTLEMRLSAHGMHYSFCTLSLSSNEHKIDCDCKDFADSLHDIRFLINQYPDAFRVSLPFMYSKWFTTWLFSLKPSFTSFCMCAEKALRENNCTYKHFKCECPSPFPPNTCNLSGLSSYN